MQGVTLPQTGTDRAWREAARGLLARGVAPDAVVWRYGGEGGDLFAQDTVSPAPASTEVPQPVQKVPRAFVDLAQTVVWHSEPERFGLLYTLLWRLSRREAVMSDRGDALLARLRRLEKSVHRDQHKMKAFVRFREVAPPRDGRRQFAAWFEPDHHIVEPASTFFMRRFADMDWLIVTPDRTARFVAGALALEPGQPRPSLPEDAAEELWSTYFCNIFNPARLMVKAMQSEMPKKYWRNMPETRHIPRLIAGAGAAVQAMQDRAPMQPPARAAQITERLMTERTRQETPAATSLEALKREAAACTRCPLYCNATQVVMGEGPQDAALMFVGEQPGDHEDLAGRPFVGPAGRLFDEVAQAAGVDRSRAFVTNAVKHFKFTPRGKRRIHQRPNAGEISQCKWWLDAEREIVRPRLTVAMGATATEALTGSGKGILSRRGELEQTPQGDPVLLTIHPSFLLRLPDAGRKAEETARFQEDLAKAQQILGH